jgi:hypothetical protein
MAETVQRVKVACIRQPGWSKHGPGWHFHTFESRAAYEAFRVLDKMRDPDDEPRCPHEAAPDST